MASIHFLTRYRLELERDDDEEKALTRTYHYAGRGIVMTTLILTIGFSPFILSQYFSLNILGTLLPMVLIVALLADLLLLPALARLRLLRWSRAGRSGVRSLYRRQRGGHNESG